LDVHKESVTANLLRRGLEGREDVDEVRSFGTMTKDLLTLADWLKEAGCTHVAMESTGVYWKPIHSILESDFEVILVNAHHIKYVPGRKTDVKDCQWIGQLLQHGLLKGSFIPPKPIRELRDLTRQRRKLIQERSSVVNRVQKVLEDANIKLGSVASDVMGKSGFSMIEAIVRGEDDPERLAELALGRLKGKKDDLRAALQGRVTEHHRFLLKQHIRQIHFLDEMIEEFSVRIAEAMQPFFDYLPLMDTIPGVALRVSEDIIAEIGADMRQFPTAHQLCSWGGACPGNNESAGKKKSGKTRKGSRWLRSALSEAAWAAGHTKKTYLGAQYRRLARHIGKKRAIIAVGHSILKIIYYVMRDRVSYRELGADFFDRLNFTRLRNYYVNRLVRLGYEVNLSEATQVA
jgi:transposase